MYKRFFLLLLLILIGLSGFSQQKLLNEVNRFLNLPECKNTVVGMQFTNMNTGESILSQNSDKLFIPASTMKLVTTAAALELLGSEYKFKTVVGFTGKKKKNFTLSGDLIVFGGGDPTLGSEYFTAHYLESHFLESWAKKVKESGISHIEGDLVFDGSIYDSEEVPVTWIWEDIGNYYGAGANAFTVYDNLFRISFESPRKAGMKSKIIACYPKIEGLEIKNEVISSDENSDRAYVFGSPFDNKRIIRGTIPKNRKSFTIKGAIHQPQQLLAEEFIKFLAKEGIFVSGKIRYEKRDRNSIKTIFVQESPPLDEIIKVLNHKSVNLFAEHLVKHVAFEMTGNGSREKGIEIITEYWKKKEVSSENFFMEDGSGLSHFNAISPRFFVDMLIYMNNKSKERNAFLNSLPMAGNSTLYGFNPESFPNHSLRAKSGSMTRIRCYSGYLSTSESDDVAFSLMVNHFSGSHSKLIGEIERLLLNLIYHLKNTKNDGKSK